MKSDHAMMLKSMLHVYFHEFGVNIVKVELDTPDGNVIYYSVPEKGMNPDSGKVADLSYFATRFKEMMLEMGVNIQKFRCKIRKGETFQTNSDISTPIEQTVANGMFASLLYEAISKQM